jgi:hypothetical protein
MGLFQAKVLYRTPLSLGLGDPAHNHDRAQGHDHNNQQHSDSILKKFLKHRLPPPNNPNRNGNAIL